MNIYQSISNIMVEVPAIAKAKDNKQQGFKYRGIDDVMNALQPLLAKNKVFVVPQVLEQAREERVNKNGGKLFYSILKVKFTFFAEDGSSVEAITIGEGMDSGDKASNKAMSIAMKYALFQVFCIPTELDDPDSESHEVAEKITEEQANTVYSLLVQAGANDEQIMATLKAYNVTDAIDLTTTQYASLVKQLKEKIEANKKAEKPAEPAPKKAAKVITEAQVKRLYTIANGQNELAKSVLAEYGFASSKDVTTDKYEEICGKIEKKVGEATNGKA